jgi:hypothetical protein
VNTKLTPSHPEKNMNVEDCAFIAELASKRLHLAEVLLDKYIQTYEDHGVSMVVHHAMKGGATTYGHILQLLFRSPRVSVRARRDAIYEGFHRYDSGVQNVAIELFKSVSPATRRKFLKSHLHEDGFEDLFNRDILKAPSEVVELVRLEMPDWIGFTM